MDKRISLWTFAESWGTRETIGGIQSKIRRAAKERILCSTISRLC